MTEVEQHMVILYIKFVREYLVEMGEPWCGKLIKYIHQW